ncbi:hypothetical protein HAX54_002952 [Datura stramonium]|uniref:F-box domain-containing protein n=1 Tax=Datura stramonium TaxID=4076 RepID=A0ABS8T4N7_DATST|nr:hypothetical protein [Datura stramonium]
MSTGGPIFLPKEIVFETLSYLPVKSLLRFKCVCKHWNVITQDFQFICLHYKRSPLIIDKKQRPPPLTRNDNSTTGEDEFRPLCSRGLLLECSRKKPSLRYNLRYRIRNPEVHHQILEIPDSPQSLISNMCIVFDPDYQVLKLLSFVYDLSGQELVFGYEFLDLHNEESRYSWRSLNLPQGNGGVTRNCAKIKVFSAMGIGYVIWDDDATNSSTIGIDILDMVNDSYIGQTSTFRTSCNYTKDDCILWNGKLSFGKIVKEELHVLVLEVYKKQKQIKWADVSVIIKLPFMRELSALQEQIKVVQVHESKLLLFWWKNKDKDNEPLCAYDIMTGKVKISRRNRDFFNAIRRPCLLAFK